MKKLTSIILSISLSLTGVFGSVAIAAPCDMPTIKESNIKNEKKIVEYDSVFLGSYPQREVIPDKYFDDDATLHESVRTGNDYIIDKELYQKLLSVDTWDESGDAVVDGIKYRRISYKDVNAESGCIYSSFIWKGSKTIKSSEGDFYYNNVDKEYYYYFKYEPVKWRVISTNEDSTLLVSDIAIDAKKYNDERKVVTWDNSSLRAYMNSKLLTTVFSKEEEELLLNIDSDKVSLLSCDDYVNSAYGFASDIKEEDSARKFSCSTYAKAMGLNTYYAALYNNVTKEDSAGMENKGNASAVWVKTAANPTDYYSKCGEYTMSNGSVDTMVCDVVLGVCPVISVKNTENDLVKKSDKISTHKHVYYKEYVTAPTCTEKGIEKNTCVLCKDTYEEEVSAMHNYTATVEWSKDCKTAKLNFACDKCKDSATVDANISEWIIESDDDYTSKYRYTAEGTYNGVTKKEYLYVGVLDRVGKITSIMNTNKGVTLEYMNSDVNEEGYIVYRQTDNGKYVKIAQLKNGTMTYTDKSVKEGHKYTYYVREVAGYHKESKDWIKKSKASNKMTIVRLATPKSVKATVKKIKGKSYISINWNKNLKASGYQVEIRTKAHTYKYIIKSNKTVNKSVLKSKIKGTYKVYVRSVKKLNKKTYYSDWKKA